MSFSLGPATSGLAMQLEQARAAALAIVVPPELANLSLDEAYEVQDALVVVRRASGAVQSGWKLGITSPVKQRVMGIATPLFGRTFADGARASGEQIAFAALIAPRTEPELAFGLGSALDPAMDAAALTRAIAWIAPALEVTSSRYRPGTRTAVELVADNTSSAAYVLGPRRELGGAAALETFATELVRNGEIVARGSTADVLGDPVNALKALAEHLARRGQRAEPGEIVLSGAITDAIPVAAGDAIEARLAGLGTAAISFV
jgi:2-oxo-3-hexenedioate decarboxylase